MPDDDVEGWDHQTEQTVTLLCEQISISSNIAVARADAATARVLMCW